MYAQTFLVLATMAISKISFLWFVKSLTMVSLDQKVAYGLMTFTGAWAVAFMISGAFQCQFPEPWNNLGNNCFNQVRLGWNFFSRNGRLPHEEGIEVLMTPYYGRKFGGTFSA